MATTLMFGISIVALASTAGAAPQHGLNFSKGCESPTLIGSPYLCSYTLSQTANATDVITITGLSDITTTFLGPVSSGNILSLLTLTPAGGAACNLTQTQCTIPFGGSITSSDYSYYSAVAGDYNLTNHTLADQATVSWFLSTCVDLNCTVGGQSGTTSSSSTVAKLPSSVLTAIQQNSATVTQVDAGTSVTDQATVTPSSATGTVSFAFFDNGSCSAPAANTTTALLASGVATSSPPEGPLAAGSYSFQATYLGDGTYLQSPAGPCEPLTVNAPNIGIVKTADAASVNAGSPIGFTLTVTNSGLGDATGVNLTDTLPTTAGLVWSLAGQGTGWAGTCAIALGILTCGPVTVPAGTTVLSSTFTVHVTSPTTSATAAANTSCASPSGAALVSNEGFVTTGNDGSGNSTATTCVVPPPPSSTANLTPGFWKNHAAAWNGKLPILLGGYSVTSFLVGQKILSEMGCGSYGALNCMAGMLLAADLNLAQGGSTCIVTDGVIAQANALLILYSYNGPNQKYTLSPADQALAMKLHDELSAYNIDGIPTC